MKRRLVIALVALSAAALSACGSGGAQVSRLDISGNADPEAEHVINDWVTALSKGDIEKASTYFAVPSIAENGTAPLRLGTRAGVKTFNASLPCGARLVAAQTAGRFTAATFRLTERPGGACGPGVGGLARTAFVVHDGKIVEWRRLPDRVQPSRLSGPIV